MDEKEELRPDPQQLLKAITKEEIKNTKGRLKIFLGMSAGVGKTYSMLEEAHRTIKLGVDVVVGIVETHGRNDTAVLVDGIPVIPLKGYKYKDSSFEEMDLDAIITRKPQLVLVDELAHTNVPGSRHPKRWQDVVELLDNGIDVYTTLNVQHIDSLKDDIEHIAGITIRETVPDMVIEAADYIELVDIPPDTLLQRLKEGKVYLGDQSEIAARNFFQKDRLTALREMVLRYAAAKIDHDLQGMVSTVERTEGWQPGERLLVAVSPSPHSQRLIRKTRRLAFSLDAPWIALYVDDGRELSEGQKSLLTKNITLARDLGAEVITTSDPRISDAILRFARQRGVTQIVIGRPPKRFLKDFFGYTLLDLLAVEGSDIDIHVLRQKPLINPYKGKFRFFAFPKEWSTYLTVFMMVMLLTFLSGIIAPYIGYKVVGFLFLVSILCLSLVFMKGPVIFASILYAIIWGSYFIPESEGTYFFHNEDFFLFFLYIFTAVLTSILIDRARKNKQMLQKREVSAEALYDIVRSIASSTSIENAVQLVNQKVSAILPGKCNIIIRGAEGLDFAHEPNIFYDDKEKAAASWVFENGKEAGWSTTTLPMVKNLYLPLKSFDEVVGLLAYEPHNEVDISIETKNFLYTVGQQLANQIDRS